MLRGDSTPSQRRLAFALCALVGAAAGWLVAAGNPGNMGLCGACFLRDLAGALGLISGKGPKIFRPEVPGVILGATLLALARRGFQARSGSFAAARFFLGVFMALGALVFLGCPFRMLQRIGGGDLNALVGLLGFVPGVGLARLLEARGYSVGRTAPAPAPVGLVGPSVALLLLALFLRRGLLLGPGPGEAGGPAHAPFLLSLAIGLAAGAALSATGFCAVSAARQLFERKKRMLVAALFLVAGYAAVAAGTGAFRASFAAQPIAHSEHLWNFLAMALVGLTGALAGGCPVRQMVMTGEGNGDAFVTTAGLVAGGALAHNWGVVTGAEGVTSAGMWAVAVGLVLCAGYGVAVTRLARTP
jgi:YedE family putative selenium metabolism protein